MGNVVYPCFIRDLFEKGVKKWHLFGFVSLGHEKWKKLDSGLQNVHLVHSWLVLRRGRYQSFHEPLVGGFCFDLSWNHLRHCDVHSVRCSYDLPSLSFSVAYQVTAIWIYRTDKSESQCVISWNCQKKLGTGAINWSKAPKPQSIPFWTPQG